MFDLVPFEHSNGSLFDVFDRMLNDSFFGGLEGDTAPCRTDIAEEGDQYILRADLPGFSKDEISVDAEGDQLTISAEHKQDEKEDKKNYIRRERRYGKLSRSFALDGIDVDKISASYNDGVLELKLPKLEEAKTKTKKVEIQ
ncbi:MAG TPA: hypothetical protein DCL64_08460 [Ruminococcaceae bacterium]|jgi:HSP20 family protein|nr:hypothetical protein [Oscillospiraceae bacterium]HBQ46251.1 hypothetical protein [Oscillospiraceae bacterium]HCB90750.1 hypothetical protein [Oscillospiraceae bacterium]